ncbi:MAG TPA: sigma-70 family RNA polymerase sigma factor [Brevundimonas sp.]|uniref:RNA polymerase sigma factor n=1 Tax=Brevundimonas sp. TaxID=1871086 RepID=UPI0026133E4B|nr:sigma-70 family RNA polymerase sigma factor [Brevundimonas sp.]HRO33957.1 sigma-70 family RNA polymerase sigma factor [Brevundimonas sp.]
MAGQRLDQDEFSRRWRPALMAFFLRRLSDRADAEDMTQDVFTRLMAGGADRANVGDGYVFQIAANLLRDRARRETVRASYRRWISSTEDFGIEALDPSRVVAARQSLSAVSGLLAAMPEKTRTIFLLYRLEAVPKRDLAQAYGMSVSAVDKHLMKAMALMMAGLGERP